MVEISYPMLVSQAVGDVQAWLLVVLPNKMKEKFGGIVIRRFQNIRYVKVHKKYFDTITLDIRHGMDRPIRFQSGKVFVELYFRHVKKS